MELSFWITLLIYLYMSAIVFRTKVLAIPLVAASETGTAQTIRIYMCGVVGQSLHLVAESYKLYR